jgi:hypothetical protein
MRFNLCLAAVAATLVTASPAFAQQAVATANATAEARGLVLQPLTLTKASDLDFGWVVSTSAAGNVVISPDDGSRTVSGGVQAVPGRNGGRATFGGAGTAGEKVVLTLSPATVLVSTTNAADTVSVNSMSLDTCGVGCVSDTRTIDSSGAFLVGVGGDFAIGVNQPNGLYSANFDLTADYQ